MKRTALLVASFALAGCGDGETGSSCSCAATVVWHGDVYFGHALDRRGPPPRAEVEGGIHPGCCDEDRPADLRQVGNVPPEVALYAHGDDDTIYLSEHYRVFLPMPGYRRVAHGQRCRIVGAISDVDRLTVARRERKWWVSVDERTRFEGFRSVLPYLGKGDRVMVDAVGCRGRGLVARRIALQP